MNTYKITLTLKDTAPQIVRKQFTAEQVRDYLSFLAAEYINDDFVVGLGNDKSSLIVSQNGEMVRKYIAYPEQ